MPSTDLAELKTFMAENPGAVIEDVARERKVTPRAVIEALPEGMARALARAISSCRRCRTSPPGATSR
jgi:putative heme iron utilization protein